MTVGKYDLILVAIYIHFDDLSYFTWESLYLDVKKSRMMGGRRGGDGG